VIGRAKRIADAHGAAHLGSLAVNTQRQIGARRPRPTRRDTTDRALSEQERRITALVARGLSNRDIATSLFVSVKTVEAHLTRIFRKLGVSSRSVLISTLAQLSDEQLSNTVDYVAYLPPVEVSAMSSISDPSSFSR